MVCYNNLTVNYAAEVLDINAFSASIGLALSGIGSVVGMLVVLIPQRMGLSSFFMHSWIVMGFGTTVILLTVVQNEVGRVIYETALCSL